MIKFFRKIRQKLISENRFSKYLIYAVGEIFLVMIGILLALQVNNWNQSRLDRNRELEIIHDLREELEVNKQYLYNILSGLEHNVKENGLKLIQLTGPNPKDVSQKEFLKMVWLTSRIPPFTPKTATFYKIINSEDLIFIRNDSMKTLLIEYQARLNWVKEDYKNLSDNGQVQEQIEKEKLPRLNMVLESENKWLNAFEGVEPSEFNINPGTILKDKYFENIIVEAIISFNYVDRSINNLIEDINQMQNFIQSNYRIK